MAERGMYFDSKIGPDSICLGWLRTSKEKACAPQHSLQQAGTPAWQQSGAAQPQGWAPSWKKTTFVTSQHRRGHLLGNN